MRWELPVIFNLGIYLTAILQMICSVAVARRTVFLKGMSLSEITVLRQTRIGTVKAQCTAIYKKAGVTGKSQLISQLVEDIIL